jgi:hypothetical protein
VRSASVLFRVLGMGFYGLRPTGLPFNRVALVGTGVAS